jgi:hypothetical protein
MAGCPDSHTTQINTTPAHIQIPPHPSVHQAGSQRHLLQRLALILQELDLPVSHGHE